MAIFVENGGYGSTIAAPITSLLVEKYITGEISDSNKYREQQMLNLSLKNIYEKQLQKSKGIATTTK